MSSSGGESMKEILKDVKGRRLRVDHPSHTVDTFEGMRCPFVSEESME